MAAASQAAGKLPCFTGLLFAHQRARGRRRCRRLRRDGKRHPRVPRRGPMLGLELLVAFRFIALEPTFRPPRWRMPLLTGGERHRHPSRQGRCRQEGRQTAGNHDANEAWDCVAMGPADQNVTKTARAAWAPRGPRSRSRPSLKMRFKCANCISIRLRSRRDRSNAGFCETFHERSTGSHPANTRRTSGLDSLSGVEPIPWLRVNALCRGCF